MERDIPRRLTESESEAIWGRLERRLTSLGEPAEGSASDPESHLWDRGGYPTRYPDHVALRTSLEPDVCILEAVQAATRSCGEAGLYLLHRERIEGDELTSSDWEIPLSELSEALLPVIHHSALEFYLCSTHDRRAIYFHHEGVAICGGRPEFIRVMREQCVTLMLEPFPWGALGSSIDE